MALAHGIPAVITSGNSTSVLRAGARGTVTVLNAELVDEG